MANIVPPVPAWGSAIFGVQPVTDDFKAYVLLLIKSMDIFCPGFAAGWSKARLGVLPVQDIKALFESVDADDWLDTFDMPGFNGGRQLVNCSSTPRCFIFPFGFKPFSV